MARSGDGYRQLRQSPGNDLPRSWWGATGVLSARVTPSRADQPPVAPDPTGRFSLTNCLRRRMAFGIHLGIATLLGCGCQSTDYAPTLALSPPLTPDAESRAAGPTVLPVATAASRDTQQGGRMLAGTLVRVGASGSPTGANSESDLASHQPADIMMSAAQFVAPRGSFPLTGSEDTIDLGIALRLGGVDNPTINLAREQIREALAGQLTARSLLLPSVNIGGNYHYHNGPVQASFGQIRYLTTQNLDLGFGAGAVGGGTVAYPGVRLFAHLGDAVYEPLAARQRVAARRSDAQATQNAILLEVASAYLSLVGAEAQLDILRRGEVDLAEILRLARAYAQTGQGRKGDADRTAANADLLRRQIRQAEEEVEVASIRLCRLLNLDPSNRLRTPGGPVDLFRLIPEDADAEALVAGAIQARPELYARVAQIQEAQVRVRQEKVRPFVPTVSMGCSSGLFGVTQNNPEFTPIKGRTDIDVFAVWNIQNLGFGNLANVRRTQAVVGEAIAGYNGTLNQVRRQVVEALAETHAATRQLEIVRPALSTAEEGFRLEMERIQGDLWRPIEVVDSYNQLVQARQEFLRAVIAFDVAQFRLFVAVGRDPGQHP
jgi:outer membrane protein TolC